MEGSLIEKCWDDSFDWRRMEYVHYHHTEENKDVVPLESYKEFLHWFDISNLHNEGLIIGGFANEMNRREFGGKHPARWSKDMDSRGTSSLVKTITDKFGKSMWPANEMDGDLAGVVISSFDLPYPPNVPGLKRNGWVQGLVFEVLDRLNILDTEPNGVLQGIRLFGHPFGSQGPKSSFIDAASVAIIRADIASRSSFRRKHIVQIAMATEVVPDMFEYASAEFGAGRLKRNPAVMARRLLGDIENKSLIYEAACRDTPRQFTRLVDACRYFARSNQAIYYTPADPAWNA